MKRLTRRALLAWLESRQACEFGVRSIRRRPLRQAFRELPLGYYVWLLVTLGIAPPSRCDNDGCHICPKHGMRLADWTPANYRAQWPFELIESLILEQIQAPAVAAVSS